MKLSVEIGGTFTDIIRVERDRTQSIFKVSTTPENPAIGALQGVIATVGHDFSEVIELIHGSTVATNAVVEHKYSATGLLVTKGFRDILEIQRQDRTNIYDIFYQKPKSLVSRDKVIEITERIDLQGSVLQPLNEEEVISAVDFLVVKKGVQSIAVSFLYSYRNPIHERRVKEIIVNKVPGILVTLSSEVVAEFREYERTSTTVLSAYIKPIVKAYVSHFTNELQRSKFRGNFFIMQSNGGILPASAIQEYPAQMFYSGPAAGVMGGVYLSKVTGVKNLMTMDMGGTSTDVCLITNGNPEITTSGKIHGIPIKLPIIDIVSVGAGGGSIGWVDKGGMPHIGPKSAGAEPGPACYNRGGLEPTVTDALVVMGLIPEDEFLGGKMKLSRFLAEKAVSSLGEKLGMDPFQAADSIYKMALANITQAMRMVSIERGYDPRDYVLCAYGGCGPLHGAYLAKDLEMEGVIIPPNPGVYSAFGLLVSEFKRDYVKTLISLTSETNMEEIKKIFEDLHEQALQEFKQFGLSGRKKIYSTSLDMRYQGQGYELNIPIKMQQLFIKGTEFLNKLFNKAHFTRYGNASDEKVQIVNYRFTVVALKEDTINLPEISKDLIPQWKKREIYLQGKVYPCEFYDRKTLPAGFELEGPGVIQEEICATIVPPGWNCRVSEVGHIYLQEKK